MITPTGADYWMLRRSLSSGRPFLGRTRWRSMTVKGSHGSPNTSRAIKNSAANVVRKRAGWPARKAGHRSAWSLHLSSSANADDPVIAGVRTRAQSVEITGCSAGACHRAGHFGPDPLAEHDKSEVTASLIRTKRLFYSPHSCTIDIITSLFVGGLDAGFDPTRNI